jgi:hypothetical protein
MFDNELAPLWRAQPFHNPKCFKRIRGAQLDIDIDIKPAFARQQVANDLTEPAWISDGAHFERGSTVLFPCHQGVA